MMKPSSILHYKDVPFAAIWPFLLIAFGIAWGLLALHIFMPEPARARFGEISGSHPMFILAVYSPAIAAVVVVWYCGGLLQSGP